jgi:peptidoglycan hydrolase CwlO-like protein
MKKKILVAALASFCMLLSFGSTYATVSCDSSTRFKCSAKDAQGNEVRGTGKAVASIAELEAF